MIEIIIKNILKICIKNNEIFSLYINCHYISPKGQNHWTKNFTYFDDDIETMFYAVKRKNEYLKSVKYQRSIMSDTLRFKVLKRDNYRCQICGASSKIDGVKLEVDHIVPVSKGGLTEINNLQTLCERCNRGKKDKYM